VKAKTAIDHSQANLEQFHKWIETNITAKICASAKKAEVLKAAKESDPKAEIPETAVEIEEAAEDEALKE